MEPTPDLSTSGRGQLLQVGDIARATGKTVRALHLYEELGLLEPITRSSGGFRLFEPSAVERVRWIDSLHALGFSLQEMREVQKSWWGAEQGTAAMDRLRELFTRKLEETREAIRRHQRLELELEEGLRYLAICENCAAPGPVHTCVNCAQDHGVSAAPALVAGINATPDSGRRTSRPVLVRLEDAIPPAEARGADRAGDTPERNRIR